jgi:capsid portal protein
LLDIYKTVFAVSGLCRKIATSVNSGFQCQDQELLSFVRQVDHEFLLQQLALFGNAFFEVIEDGKGDIVELIPAPAQTIRILRNGVGFVQKKGINKAYFNNFTPLVERNEQTQRWIRSKAGRTTITTGGYNPNITQMIHFRLSSVDDTYY